MAQNTEPTYEPLVQPWKASCSIGAKGRRRNIRQLMVAKRVYGDERQVIQNGAIAFIEEAASGISIRFDLSREEAINLARRLGVAFGFTVHDPHTAQSRKVAHGCTDMNCLIATTQGRGLQTEQTLNVRGSVDRRGLKEVGRRRGLGDLADRRLVHRDSLRKGFAHRLH